MVNVAGTSGNQVAGVPSPTLPLTVTPPAGVHFVAFVRCTQGALSVPPEFTEIYATDWTRVYYAAETPGSAWSIGAGVDPEELLAVRIIGTDVAITQPSVVSAAWLTSPTATEAGLAVRGLSAWRYQLRVIGLTFPKWPRDRSNCLRRYLAYRASMLRDRNRSRSTTCRSSGPGLSSTTSTTVNGIGDWNRKK